MSDVGDADASPTSQGHAIRFKDQTRSHSMLKKFWVFLAVLPGLVACRYGVVTNPTPTMGSGLISTQPASVPSQTVSPPDNQSVPESILILEPGPGSRLVSPLHVAGIADSTFEQNLVVRLLLDDGSQLALMPTTIQSELGQRGEFQVELPFSVSGERQAFIQVFSSSPRDGGITHLASTGVLLADTGLVDIRSVEAHPERIQITNLTPGDSLSGGVAHVEGFALASFEQTLVVDILDEDGSVLGSQPLIVDSPEWGQPGPFQVDVTYSVTTSGAGRVVVRDPSPAFAGDVHVASIEVKLNP